MNQSIKEMEKETEQSRDRNLIKKIKKYQMQCNEQSKKLAKMQESYQKNKNKLNLFNTSKNMEREQREQMVINTQNMQKQTDQFRNLNAVAIDTEGMTHNIQNNLKE